MNSYVFAGIIFLCLAVIIEMLLYAWRASGDVRKSKKILNRLQKNSSKNSLFKEQGDVHKTRVLSSIPFFNKILLKINLIERLENLIKQANSSYAPAVYLLLVALFSMTGFFYGRLMLRSFGLGLIIGLVGFLLPIAWLYLQKIRRLQKFAEQLPDALDLVARSLKAGHSFSSGLQLVSENFDDPIGTEFNATIQEINYGLPMTDALKNLGRRVGSSDLNFFIIAAVLQRETGGNLAEITGNIATLIRERFKFEDKVRVLSAEGKISAFILIALPIVLFFVILNISPQYIEVLMDDPFGRKAAYISIALMLFGIVTILKMIRIKL